MLEDREIVAAKAQAFRDQQYRCEYEVGRGLFHTEYGPAYDSVILPGYNELVPLVNGVELADVLFQLGQQSPKGEVLDVGCGAGVYLYDAASVYGLRAQGITACYYPIIDHPSIGTKSWEDLQALGIDIQVGSADRLLDRYGKNRFDVVTAIHLMGYMADPWSTFEQMYAVIKPGGYGFVHALPDGLLDDSERARFHQDMKSHGFVLEEKYKDHYYNNFYWNIGFKKEADSLGLSLKPKELSACNYGGRTIHQLRYSYKPAPGE